tara:strand:- start:1161 stop:1292 length:132 start_codon:yes stop_codon:yes gene_type:complete
MQDPMAIHQHYLTKIEAMKEFRLYSGIFHFRQEPKQHNFPFLL